MELVMRPRRLRRTDVLRRMVRETRISESALIYPVFVREGTGIREEISAMPGQFRYSVDMLPEKMESLLSHGVKQVMFFGIPDEKDEEGSGSYAEDGVVQKAFREIKSRYPELYLIGDVCMCEYTSHGHCGILCGHEVDNDKTVEVLAKIALSHVQAGADMVAPSDMMDGRCGVIRKYLDDNGHTDIPVMAYSAKFASAFYGPFREAAGSAPAFGDRSSYQMDYHNRIEAVKEAQLDVAEGADIIMVKPAMAYGDLIREIKDSVDVPVAAYSVSGEYSMIKSVAKAGLIDEKRIMCESAVCAFRAGADIYITYYAEELADAIRDGVIG